jgi:hypothetical protein
VELCGEACGGGASLAENCAGIEGQESRWRHYMRSRVLFVGLIDFLIQWTFVH